MGPQSSLLLACRGGLTDRHDLHAPNPHGQLVRFRPTGGDAAASVFLGEVVLPGGPRAGRQPWMSRPTALAVDGGGGCWIATEASGLVHADAGSFAVLRVYDPPVGAAMGGVAFTPDGASVVTSVRHPGATSDASFERPATRWPTLRADQPPQSTVITLSYLR